MIGGNTTAATLMLVPWYAHYQNCGKTLISTPRKSNYQLSNKTYPRWLTLGNCWIGQILIVGDVYLLEWDLNVELCPLIGLGLTPNRTLMPIYDNLVTN